MTFQPGFFAVPRRRCGKHGCAAPDLGIFFFFFLRKVLQPDFFFFFLGDNILAVLRYLLMSEKMADASEYRHGNMVFFDLLGVFVVAYPARVGTILNYVVAAATFLYLAKKASQPGNGGRSPFPPPRRRFT